MEGSSDLRFNQGFAEGPGQKEEIRKVEGSSGLRFSREFEEGPGQKQEIEKWRGPVA